MNTISSDLRSAFTRTMLGCIHNFFVPILTNRHTCNISNTKLRNTGSYIYMIKAKDFMNELKCEEIM